MSNKADDFMALVKAGKIKEAQTMVDAEKLRVERAKLKDKLYSAEAKLKLASKMTGHGALPVSVSPAKGLESECEKLRDEIVDIDELLKGVS